MIETADAIPLVVLPLANVVRSIAPDEPTIAMFDVSFEHAFVDISTWEDLSTHAIYLSIILVNFLPEEILDGGAEASILKYWTLLLRQQININGSQTQPTFFRLLIACIWNALHKMEKLLRES